MIPSDHFVRFYNEVFKFLKSVDGLENYYAEISHHQELHCLELFRDKGLSGVYEYYQKIYKEENCQGEVTLNGGELILRMDRCPSLSKALDNDAGACREYCLHCPGWTAEIYRKAKLYQIFDVMKLDEPQCCEWIYDNKADAERKAAELRSRYPEHIIMTNFQ